jgi:phytoene synthase
MSVATLIQPPARGVTPATVRAESRAVLAKHGRSFHLAGVFLPADQLDDAAVAYAFCRLVDDLADEAPDRATAERDLERLEAELEGRASARPVVVAYVEMARRRAFSLDVARDLVAGVRSDLGAVRVADDAELSRYCYRVAGTVGLMMAAIMGVTAPAAAAPAKALGEAMQLTNICRDVLEDTRRDRCYLPDSLLSGHGVDGDAVVRLAAPRSAIVETVGALLDRAEALYRQAWDGMHFIPWRPRIAILVATRVYRQIGVRLRRKHAGDPLHGRTVVPTGERVWMVARGLADALRPRMWGWVRR